MAEPRIIANKQDGFCLYPSHDAALAAATFFNESGILNSDSMGAQPYDEEPAEFVIDIVYEDGDFIDTYGPQHADQYGLKGGAVFWPNTAGRTFPNSKAPAHASRRRP